MAVPFSFSQGRHRRWDSGGYHRDGKLDQAEASFGDFNPNKIKRLKLISGRLGRVR
jgi:hypothetical protein